jgi:hypothetical protein
MLSPQLYQTNTPAPFRSLFTYPHLEKSLKLIWIQGILLGNVPSKLVFNIFLRLDVGLGLNESRNFLKL